MIWRLLALRAAMVRRCPAPARRRICRGTFFERLVDGARQVKAMVIIHGHRWSKLNVPVDPAAAPQNSIQLHAHACAHRLDRGGITHSANCTTLFRHARLLSSGSNGVERQRSLKPSNATLQRIRTGGLDWLSEQCHWRRLQRSHFRRSLANHQCTTR